MPRALLIGINAKYVHSCLAVYCLKACADAQETGFDCEIMETTISVDPGAVAEDILSRHPAVAAFSCYIWNIGQIKACVRILRARAPSVVILFGGPEVSFTPEVMLDENLCDYVIRGEGEKPFTRLLSALHNGEPVPAGFGICHSGHIEPPYVEKDLSSLPLPYTDEYLKAVSGRIAYIESTRGCPFSCAFCLSGGTGLRRYPIDGIKDALKKLYRSGARVIKFVDRTFNASEEHANELIRFITDMTNGDVSVCFHFEIAADILRDSTVALLLAAPKGLFQIEAGLQSFHEPTLAAVTRRTDPSCVERVVHRLAVSGSLHTHIDLIAGLPYEGLDSFARGFDRAYAIGADMLQLGFLKGLYGSRLRDMASSYGLRFSDTPPYEIVSTPWLSEDDLNVLKNAEDANDKLHNSGRFRETLAYVLSASGLSPFALFVRVGKVDPMPLDDYTALIFDLFSALPGVDRACLRDHLCLDRLRTNFSARLPKCLKIDDPHLKDIRARIDRLYPRPPSARRVICPLYTQDCVAVFDYDGENSTFLERKVPKELNTAQWG